MNPLMGCCSMALNVGWAPGLIATVAMLLSCSNTSRPSGSHSGERPPVVVT